MPYPARRGKVILHPFSIAVFQVLVVAHHPVDYAACGNLHDPATTVETNGLVRQDLAADVDLLPAVHLIPDAP